MGWSKQRESHLLDIVYLFQNFQEFLTIEQQALGRHMATDFLKFCHGQSPWVPVQSNDFEKGFHARVYGSREEYNGELRDINYPFVKEADRRGTLWDCASAASLDKLLAVFHSFRGF